jgi:flavin-dependent dehydrogenase
MQDPEGPGWRVDRAAFNRALLQAAQDAGAPWIQDRVVGVLGGLQLEHQTLAVTAVVDASGRRAAVARRLGVTRTVLDRTLARVAWGQGDLLDQRTLVESVPDGWWYSAALPEGQVVAALHTQTAASVRTQAAWEHALSQAPLTQARLQGVQWTHHRTADAGVSRLDAPGGPGWLAVGDAVQAFDPLGSQGMLHALYSGLQGARALLQGDLRGYAADLQRVWTAQVRQRNELLAAKRAPG